MKLLQLQAQAARRRAGRPEATAAPGSLEFWAEQRPGVTAVIGGLRNDFGETPMGIVELEPNAVVTGKEIAESLTDLASYKRPKTVEILNALPRNTVGKILKT